MDYIWLNQLQEAKNGEVLVRFDAFQNPIFLCRNSRDMGKCRSGANMPEWNFNICNL